MAFSESVRLENGIAPSLWRGVARANFRPAPRPLAPLGFLVLFLVFFALVLFLLVFFALALFLDFLVGFFLEVPFLALFFVFFFGPPFLAAFALFDLDVLDFAVLAVFAPAFFFPFAASASIDAQSTFLTASRPAGSGTCANRQRSRNWIIFWS